jgi:hypothetical protein
MNSNLHPLISGNKIVKNTFCGVCSQQVDRRDVNRFSVGKTEGKVPLERLKRRWDNVIQMDFKEVGCRGMSWIEMTLVRER